MSKLNPNAVVALEKVAAWLEAGAQHVVIDNKGRVIDRFDMNYGVDQNSCGTSCCIAGAVVQFEGLGDLYRGGLGFFGGENSVESLAKRFIGDDSLTLNMLFLPWEYFEPKGGEDYDNQAGPFSKPQKAAKVVRHYLATGEVDWTIVGFVRK